MINKKKRKKINLRKKKKINYLKLNTNSKRKIKHPIMRYIKLLQNTSFTARIRIHC